MLDLNIIIQVYDHDMSSSIPVCENPSFGWDAVSPEAIYDVIEDVPKPKKEPPRSKSAYYALIVTIPVSLVIITVLVVSFVVVTLNFNQENQMLKQQVEELISRPFVGVTSQSSTNQQLPTTQVAMTSKAPTTSPEITTQQTAAVNSETTQVAALSTTSSPAIGSLENPANSCRDIPQGWSSGNYWIQSSGTGSPVLVFCDTDTRNCRCGTSQGWMRVVNLDMTDPSQQCPDGLRFVSRATPPQRTCGRFTNVGNGCASTVFPVHGVIYSHVCGRVIGYQDGSVDAFRQYAVDPPQTIDSVYFDGVVLTHGQSPRQHIWTFAAAIGEQVIRPGNCPCILPDHAEEGDVPPFIGQDYFCDTGNRGGIVHAFFSEDPLWDGQGCRSDSTCCEFNNPPWFCKQLPQPTTNDIELRICANLQDEDIPVEIIEIYVQ